MWVGLQNFKEEKMYDDSDIDANPFQTALISKKIYANGKEFIDKVSYNVDLRRWDRACMYLQAKSFGKFKTTHTEDCDKLKNFICKWNNGTCPYNYVPSFTDGRTCVGITENAVELEKAMCESELDELRSPLVNLNPEIIDTISDNM